LILHYDKHIAKRSSFLRQIAFEVFEILFQEAENNAEKEKALIGAEEDEMCVVTLSTIDFVLGTFVLVCIQLDTDLLHAVLINLLIIRVSQSNVILERVCVYMCYFNTAGMDGVL
jgi:hypothetical protein